MELGGGEKARARLVNVQKSEGEREEEGGEREEIGRGGRRM